MGSSFKNRQLWDIPFLSNTNVLSSSMRPSSAAWSDTPGLMNSPLLYAAMLLKATTLEEMVTN